ncbi:alpha/beta hydrolase [Paraburkholderia pallida]|uniref:Alpha/beta hydrolase n=1 Tax=Paraburkholderia pallida TaxID=2547399 RepID=A0A4V1B0R8_9BURK|nr:alpha/beta hydrolase [Paraburkholderia pallida]QBR03723.1 alpha/beta hydrolase [Paraburkholderia pallida]
MNVVFVTRRGACTLRGAIHNGWIGALAWAASVIVLFGLVECAAYAEGPTVSPDVATAAFLAETAKEGGAPHGEFSAKQVRDAFSRLQANAGVDKSGSDVITRTIDQNGVSVSISIVRPKGEAGVLPAFLFLHGGGWVAGDFPSHERMVLELVRQSGAAAIFVNYSRAPEAPYPKALDEVYAASVWAAAHGKEVGVDGSRLAVVGNSAGGNLAAALCLLAKSHNAPKLRFEGLMWPVLATDFHDGSYQRYAHGYSPGPKLMEWFWNQYVPNVKERENIYAAPLRATVDQLRGLPPTLIQLAQLDVVHDEGASYGRKLDAAGVAVTTTSYSGTIHNFSVLNALAHDAPSEAAIRQLATELRVHLR